jgi:hypothetical protein
MATRTVVSPATVEPTRPPRHAGRNKELEDWLDQQGVKWTFHPDVPLDAFNEESSLNNQVRFNPITDATVEQYAKAMEEGAKFPPILVHQKYNKFVRLDGNHRVAAKRKVGADSIHVYEAHVSGQQAVLLAFKANNRNGLPNSEDERISHGLYLLRSGASLKVAAAEMVVPERTLKAAWTKQEANARADDVGLLRKEWDGLTAAVKGRLKNISTDEGFRAAALLCYRAKFGIEETTNLVTEVNTTKSGRKQEAIVKAWGDAYSERIAEGAGGVLTSGSRGKGRTPKQTLGLALGSLATLPEDMGSLAEQYAGDERDEVARRVRTTGERLLVLADKLAADA